MTVRKQLFYGSLQDHNRASRKEMNQSYVNQQNQLMSMNVVREAQRLQRSQAETIIKLNQLKDELTKAPLPPTPLKVNVVPNSNAALEHTLPVQGVLLGPPEPVPRVEEKTTKTTMAIETDETKASPSGSKASSRASSNYGSAPTSPSPSEAPTVSTSTTAQGNVGSPAAKLMNAKGQLKAYADKHKEFKTSIIYSSLSRSNPSKAESQWDTIRQINKALADAREMYGGGLGRGKNGRFKR